MADNDTPLEGPLSIDDVLDTMDDREAAPEVEEGATLEAGAEEVETEEVEADATDESEEQDEPDADDEGPEVYDVSEYGEISVRLADGTQTTLADLAKGTLRQADYTRKTTELAATKKELEAAKAAISDKERQLNERLASLEEQEPDWEKMAEEDPLGLPLAQIQWNRKQQQKAEARKAAEAREAQERSEFQRQTAETALRLMPEWTDGKSFNETAELRKEAALAAGFTEAEYNQAVDFRLAVILEKAARYDAGQTKVKAAAKKLSSVKRVVKPGASVTKADKEQAAQVAKSKRLNQPMSVNDYLDVKLG